MSEVKLFVGNLPYSVQWRDLKNLFADAGNVLRADVQSDTNSRSRGYGFVSFATREEAENAIQMFNGHDMNGRNIEVREDRGSQGGVRQQGVAREQFVHEHDPNMVNRTTLFVGNLPWSVAWQDLKDLFRQAGNVARADIATDFNLRRSKGFGTVTMSTVEEARKAVSMFNGFDWNGRMIEVREDRQMPALERDVGRIVYISNLPITAGWQDLKDTFRPHGDVRRADIHLDAQGNPTGHGTVIMGDPSEVKNAIDALNGAPIQGAMIALSETPFEGMA